MKCVFFSIPVYSRMKTNLALVRALVNNGYTIYYHADEKYKSIVEETGAVFVPYKTDIKPYLKAEIADGGLNNALKAKLDMDNLMYDEAVKSIEEFTPNSIMHDGMAGFAKHAAAAKSIKAISISTTIIPNTLIFLLNGTLIKSTVKAFLKSPIKTIKVLKESGRNKKSYGVKQNSFTDPFVNEEGLNIVFLPELLQPFRNSLGSKYFFARPIIGENTSEDGDIVFSTARPLVYVSLGNISGDCEKETKAIIRILLKKEVNILLSTCNGMDIDIPKDEKLIIKKFVNQEDVLRETSLFINHGGIHSIYEAIWYKVPQICIPNQTEQEVNARIVQKKKCGVYVKKIDERKLEKAIDLILAKKMKLNVEVISDIIKKGAPMENVIKRIEEYLGEMQYE